MNTHLGRRFNPLGEEVSNMIRVMPRQVVDLIDSLFPFAMTEQAGTSGAPTLDWRNRYQLVSLLELAGNIPEHLVILDAELVAKFVIAMAVLRTAVTTWENNINAPNSGVAGMPQFDGLHPVTAIRLALANCADEAPSPDTTGLEFIEDPDLRESIRLDISTANIDLANGESKAATVMAGAAVEALLLWALEEHTELADRTQAVSALGINPVSNLERWTLGELIPVAGHLEIIVPNTVTLAKLTQNPRNLIHPGSATRLRQTCDRGTALSAVPAVEHISRDLAQQYTK